jgi:nucleotide-binding universal stress UspA family protein
MKNHGFGRILLATDGSEQAEAAVAVAASFALASNAAVRVEHVWSLEVHHRHGVWDVEMRSEADRLIRAAVSRLRAVGVEADGELSRADHKHVAAAVGEAARQFKADLVVVGSRGLTDWKALLDNSVSHNLLRSVDCPVLIVRGKPSRVPFRPRRVLLAIAGGDDVTPAVRAAIAAASADGSTVRVLHVAQAFVGAQGFSYFEPEEEIQATVTTATDMLQAAGIATDSVVAKPGSVAQVVADAAAAWQADVIVIGSSRMSDVAGVLFGSVTHDLLRATERPVLVAERIRA